MYMILPKSLPVKGGEHPFEDTVKHAFHFAGKTMEVVGAKTYLQSAFDSFLGQSSDGCDQHRQLENKHLLQRKARSLTRQDRSYVLEKSTCRQQSS